VPIRAMTSRRFNACPSRLEDALPAPDLPSAAPRVGCPPCCDALRKRPVRAWD
jgi:hypothetical protein